METTPNAAGVERPPSSSKSHFYRPELDCLRFVAFLLVFCCHTLSAKPGLFSSIVISGAFGVCLFFLLSAYLITELLEREANASGTINLPSFYVRRILRIWPLYFAILLIDFVLQRHHPGVFPAGRLLAFVLLAGNWYTARHGYTYTVSSPLWSISVEEQFYLLWPSVRKYLRRTGAIVFSSLMLVFSYVVLYILCTLHANVQLSIWLNSFLQFQFFSAGALLAFALRGAAPRLSSLTRVLFATASLALFTAAQHVFHIKEAILPPSFAYLALGYMCVNVGCVLIFLSFLGESRFGKLRPIVYLGRISYGLYVFHWFVFRLVYRLTHHNLATNEGLTPLQALLALGLTIALAAACYRFFEAPILRYKKHFEIVRTRPV